MAKIEYQFRIDAVLFDIFYWRTAAGYFYKQYRYYNNGELSKINRVSYFEYISAYEMYMTVKGGGY